MGFLLYKEHGLSSMYPSSPIPFYIVYILSSSSLLLDPQLKLHIGMGYSVLQVLEEANEKARVG